ncbi:DUF1109 domain-containing protein [Sphingopyxis sp. SE2]|uniref:DUF1109 domain-containing protein n=1 Tax=Sphingopyxis sp. SE2 TaxID=1586240 RepID=UPI0028C3412E|nr:DUF1109 domain-containing protein [Sphingopyxis sp. SE2]MDT7531211.1 DUF1109 domain-containing protein [Sphingopyxis sp. SE2]
MQTNELVEKLSANLRPVDRGIMIRTFRRAVGAGLLLAVAAVWIAFGVPLRLHDDGAVGFLILKLLFTGSLIVFGFQALVKLARPGRRRPLIIALVGLPFLALALSAAPGLLAGSHIWWNSAILGRTWSECLLVIPALAIVPFALIIWAIRRGAPTSLRGAGALAGALAGAVSASAYALACRDDSVAFVACWYTASILLCAVTGALLGPRLLRW